ncbi:MAG: hypothetical protein J5842_07355 [Lachnospiraceae bacterium]|nr:hypothetical protein [Lachnospiraceae bacterium]
MRDFKRSKRWLEILAFIPVCVCILLLFSYCFDPVRTDHAERVNERDIYVVSALTQDPDSIDVAVLGDSEALVLLWPKQLWEDANISSYIIGQSGQSVSESYYVLNAFFERQSPKVVFFEADTLVDDSNERREQIEQFNSAAYHFFPIFRHHNEWKEMTGIKEASPIEHDRGFGERKKIKPYEGGEYMHETDKREKILFSSKRYFRKIVKLCRQKGTELVIVSAPAPLHFNYEKHKALSDLAAENGLTYIDFNLMNEEIGIDWETDMLDGGDHVNLTGTSKITSYLIQYLRENQFKTDSAGQ